MAVGEPLVTVLMDRYSVTMHAATVAVLVVASVRTGNWFKWSLMVGN